MNDTTLQIWLLEHGFSPDDVNVSAAYGMTPLMRAARQGSREIVDTLLRNGARLATCNADGNNALWFACVGEHLDMIDLLVKSGIDLDNQNINGATCLMYASSTGKDTVVKTLLDAGADRTRKSLDDFTALDVASTLGCLQQLRGN